ALLDGTCYVTRQSVHTPANVRKTKADLKNAIENAIDKKGTSVVEVVATCNSGWKMSPEKANEWMVENMFPKYPLGDLKNE
ncbi:MAG: 2-oxoglutarate oxidoreductase, partial [Muribaculaceae bacterium]|nr:2-oxoglutarate oxidoreductase [Muribaculaceae bacterium]